MVTCLVYARTPVNQLCQLAFWLALQGRGMRRLLGLFIVVLVFTRGVIPAGFMPVTGKYGFLDIVICVGDGAASVGLGKDGKPAAPQEKTKVDKAFCPFAATSWLTLGAQPQNVLYPLVATSPLSPPFADRVPIVRFASDASARSPPRLQT